MTETMSRRAATLRVEGASKTFTAARVLSDVSFTLHAGEICALIGQNGSGKSTLIKLLSGFHEPDDGLRVHMGSRPIDNLRAGAGATGLAFVHQDLALVPSMTIVENLRINKFDTGLGGRIKWRAERETVRGMLRRVGLDVSPDRKVADLSITERALVAIARGLSEIALGNSAEAQLLVLDEPTAYLPRSGVVRLFEVLHGLAGQGVSILFVSHRLDEVLEYCDRILVLRNGRLVADRPLENDTSRSLVELMIGAKMERLYPNIDRTDDRDTVLEVAGLAGRYAQGVSFRAAHGEIVGFVGLPGGGYDEIPYLLAGARPSGAGHVTVDGRTTDATDLSPRAALRLGIAMLPADRKTLGGALALTARENMTLPTLGGITRWRTVLRSRAERGVVAEQLARYDVHPGRGDLALALYSGGNQQKVMLAKWLMAGPTVLALHEPTQGVDVGAKREVFQHLAAIAEQGATVLISSVEYEDLAHLCDRVYVVRDGVVVRMISGPELTAHEVAGAVYE